MTGLRSTTTMVANRFCHTNQKEVAAANDPESDSADACYGNQTCKRNAQAFLESVEFAELGWFSLRQFLSPFLDGEEPSQQCTFPAKPPVACISAGVPAIFVSRFLPFWVLAWRQAFRCGGIV